MIDATISPWPRSGDDLCQLLHIIPSPDLKCHGQTKKAKNCKRPIGAKNAKAIKDLLNAAAAAGNLDAAQDQLERLSGLVLCERDHQEQKVLLYNAWEAAIHTLQEQYAAILKANEAKPKKNTEPRVKSEPVTVKIEPVEVKLEPKKPKVEPAAYEPKPDKPATKSVPASPPKDKATTTKERFEPYGSLRSSRTVNMDMKQKILEPLRPKEVEKRGKGGSVYVYTFPEMCTDATPFLKIGYAEDVGGRMKKWKAQCGYEPSLIMDFKSSLYIRVERLVHAQLWNCRKRERKGCPACGRQHQEWFHETTNGVSGTIGLWVAWIRREPYDEAGKLKEEWAQKLKKLDLDDSTCWNTFVNGETKRE